MTFDVFENMGSLFIKNVDIFNNGRSLYFKIDRMRKNHNMHSIGVLINFTVRYSS